VGVQRQQLTSLVEALAGELEAWEDAELYLLEQAFRERLAKSIQVNILEACCVSGHVLDLGIWR